MRNRSRCSPRKRGPVDRRGIVIAVVLAGMVLVLLMLGAIARQVILEHRAIDSRLQSIQADWLLWSARQKLVSAIDSKKEPPTGWELNAEESMLGKSIAARFLPIERSNDSEPLKIEIRLEWTTKSGLKIERSQVLHSPAVSEKETP